jgi:hypothetical protein
MKTARPARPKTTTSSDPGLENGYRSGLEEKVAAELAAKGIPVEYESEASVIRYLWPAEPSRYTPDFVLPNGVIIETKGRFTSADRKKHRIIKAEHPGKDIRFVFSNSRQRISKTSSTTYAMWCQKYAFQYADKSIPDAWLREPRREAPDA